MIILASICLILVFLCGGCAAISYKDKDIGLFFTILFCILGVLSSTAAALCLYQQFVLSVQG